jgi:metal-responsive CopG/Arc/MetJ family transcriptional regulator
LTPEAFEAYVALMEPDGPDDQRISLNLSPALLAQVEEWRFEHRVANRNEAIRDLIRRGLATDSTNGTVK